MTSSFPSGWTIASIGEIADFNPRHSRDLDEHLPISFVPMAGVNEDQPKFKFTEERLLGEVRQGFTHFAEGDVLFAKITPCMENGKAAVARGLKNGLGCGSTEFHVMRPHHGIDPRYVYRFIHQESFRRAAKQNFTGTAGQARVPISFVREAAIPLPPVDEQKRIVEKLEKLLEKVGGCNARLERIPSILKRFRQSVLAAACSGRLTADWREQCPAGDKSGSTRVGFDNEFPETWRTTNLGKLASLVTSGSRGWAKYYADTGSTFIRAQNINSDVLNLDDVAFVQLPNRAEGVRTKVHKNDILVTITGANVTKAALVDVDLENAYISQSVALVRFYEAKARRRFLFLLDRSAPTRAADSCKMLLTVRGSPGLNSWTTSVTWSVDG